MNSMCQIHRIKSEDKKKYLKIIQKKKEKEKETYLIPNYRE